jgi:drug/metabolite transporter (DMT)-like permease
MRVRGGYAALYSAAIVFAFTSLFVKLASRYYSGLFISSFRFAVGSAALRRRPRLGYRSLKPGNPGLVALRGVFGALSMAMTYIAISMTGPGARGPPVQYLSSLRGALRRPILRRAA